MKKQEACLVCGKPLVYFETVRPMTCLFCGGTLESYASCEDGHYVCDACHAQKGVADIMDYCLHTDARDPAAITCTHSAENQECLRKACPYHPHR